MAETKPRPADDSHREEWGASKEVEKLSRVDEVPQGPWQAVWVSSVTDTLAERPMEA